MASIVVGELLAGKYRVEQIVGEGGMGAVVLATHVGFDDRVAVKLLHPDIAGNAELVARFLREGRAARKIQSEHVVRVTDVGTQDGGVPYMVMEYLEGHDLAQHLSRNGPVPVADAVEWVLQACEAIAEAHSLGIVHRDLKPGNLFLTRRRDGSACIKVLDFGISKSASPLSTSAALTKTAGTLGSPLYMSPEQLQSARDVDARTDVWSLGIILYELLAGALPFHGDTLPQLSISIMMKEPEPLRVRRPDVPEQLEAVIDHCLRKNRDERFRTVGAFAAALAPFATPTARISIDRVVRISGATPPPADASAQVASVAAPAMPLLSTTTGTSAGSVAPRARNRSTAWIAAGVGVALVAGAIAIVASRGGDRAPKTTSNAAPATQSEAATAAETAAPTPTPTPMPMPTPTPSATETTAPVPTPTTSAKPTPAKTATPKKPVASPTKPKPPPKSNDDDPTL